MKHLSSNNLIGIWCSIQLPILADNSIDFNSLKEEMDMLTNTSIQGIYSNGTAAEFYNQTESEFDGINEMMADICHKKRFPFQIGASHMSPIISRERIRRTKALNPKAFQITLPEWLPLNSDEQLSFLAEVIEEADPIPVVLYSPGHSKTVLTPSDFKRISDRFPQLIGIKVGAGGLEWYAEMRKMNGGLAVFVPGHRLATGIKEGVAKGSYSNVACINPNAAQKWFEIIIDNIDEGIRIENQILHFFEEGIVPLARAGYSDAALDKLLWALSGRSTTSPRLRWPYIGVRDHVVEDTRKIAQRILPDFFQV
ncbi:dihydrodipicolinate synthase family protein [Membranicola marinus]|uniref:Dihydrodipicolinate synthase family protein n=1 Tax=Membranihabitans marinus TaxID=1227546 RepID=A0A953L9C1_9BACT|nr:dihydrodipicolinate synthase family protein [Membranihabitans marinus]MBY5956501.1 dihydrodipicolinate synthase family protein [Membranihabitans marinus]